MSSDALEQGVKTPNEMQNLGDSDPLTGETLEQWFMGLVQRVKDLPNPPPKIDYVRPEVYALLEQSTQRVREDCQKPAGKDDRPQELGYIFRLRDPALVFRGQLREGSLLPWCIPLHEESEAERIRRSLAFYAVPPLPLPAHLWLLTDPPYEATDPARRCLRVKLRPSPEGLRKELRRRKRRRNHAP